MISRTKGLRAQYDGYRRKLANYGEFENAFGTAATALAVLCRATV